MANTAINHDPAATFPGSSTNTAVVKWSGTGGKTLINSGVTIDSSNNVTVPGNITTTGYIHLTGDTQELRFYENGNFIAIKAPSLGADYTLTLPINDGSADEFLQTNGSGVLTWAAAGGDLSFGGDTFGADKVIGSNDAYDLAFETSGTTRMTIDSGGKIGIGLTSSAKMLHLLSSSNSDKTAVVRVESTGQGATGFQLFGPGDAASNAKKFEILSLRENATDPAKFRIASLNDSEGAVATIMEMTHAGAVSIKSGSGLTSVTKGVAKGWCQIAANGTLSSPSYNVASVSSAGTGQRSIVWDTDFSSTVYSMVAEVNDTASLNGMGFYTFATGSVTLNVRVLDSGNNNTYSLVDGAAGVAAYGDQ